MKTLRVLENHKHNTYVSDLFSSICAQKEKGAGLFDLVFIFALGKNPFHDQGRRQQHFLNSVKCVLLEIIFTLFLKSMPKLLES